MNELKHAYNTLLDRFKRAEAYMDCFNLQGKELEEKIIETEKYLPELIKILDGMDKIIVEIRSMGFIVSDENILNGFGG